MQSDRDDLEHRRSTWKLSDLSRYLELYLTVDYYYQSKDLENKPPFNFAKLAAKAKADGIINSNRALQEIADNIIRYEVWSGGPYREAFGHAQVVTSRSAKNFREHYGQIIDSYINGGIGELTQPLLPPSISE